MPNARDVHGTVYNKGSAVLMARVVNSQAQPITRAVVSSISYTVFEVPESGFGEPIAVTGHQSVPIQTTDAVFDTLQSNDAWTIDSVGYNFRHEVDVSSAEAFPNSGVCYLVRYEIVPVQGQIIVFRFHLRSL